MFTHVQLLIDDAQPDVAEAHARSVLVPPGFEHGFMAAHLRHCLGIAQLAQGKCEQAAATLAEADSRIAALLSQKRFLTPTS